jgi:DNA-directed RNA polymerase subunit RPC12/RpoP
MSDTKKGRIIWIDDGVVSYVCSCGFGEVDTSSNGFLVTTEGTECPQCGKKLILKQTTEVLELEG